MKKTTMLALLALAGCGFDRAAHLPPGDPIPEPTRFVMEAALARGVKYSALFAKEFKYARAVEVPTLVICKNEDELVLHGGKKVANKTLAGICSYANRTIYVVGRDTPTLYHELGHWYFGIDEKTADDFMNFCVKEDAYLEVGVGPKVLEKNDE